MRLLVDQNLSPVIAERLRSAGHDVVHTGDLDLAMEIPSSASVVAAGLLLRHGAAFDALGDIHQSPGTTCRASVLEVPHELDQVVRAPDDHHDLGGRTGVDELLEYERLSLVAELGDAPLVSIPITFA